MTVGAEFERGQGHARHAGPDSARTGMNLVAGASNVSFGLPDRPTLNAAFIAMAMTNGLDCAITNPLEPAVHTAILAADLLLGHDAYGASGSRLPQA